ncbi:MAG: FHA domain-containing protein, partial [Deltaproteobacteria bacterium]|nr:FHA domain-containing protein [Deltaproteobacteria bacterium]
MPAIGAIEVFVFRQGQFVGSRMFSPDRVVTIGRALDQGLRLDDEEVSSRHATLRVVDGRLVIADAGSRNGVYVNGRKVQSAKVSSFDEILVGGCRLKIDIVGGMGQEEAQGGAELERTRVGPAPAGPGSTGTQPPRSAATSTFVPRMAEPPPDAASDGPTTARFMRTVPAEPPAPAAPPPAPPVDVAPPPAAPPRA